MSPGGGRPHGGSFPFKRDVDGDGIVLGLLRHEDGCRSLRLGAPESASLRRVCAFLRLAGRFTGRIKCELGTLYLSGVDGAGRFGHGFLFSEVLSINGSLLFLIILKSLLVVAVETYGFVKNPKSQPAQR